MKINSSNMELDDEAVVAVDKISSTTTTVLIYPANASFIFDHS